MIVYAVSANVSESMTTQSDFVDIEKVLEAMEQLTMEEKIKLKKQFEECNEVTDTNKVTDTNNLLDWLDKSELSDFSEVPESEQKIKQVAKMINGLTNEEKVVLICKQKERREKQKKEYLAELMNKMRELSQELSKLS